MKMRRLIRSTTILALFVLTACNKTDNFSNQTIEGVYVGTLTTDGLKSTSGIIPGTVNATTEITNNGNDEIEVHCFSNEFDTIFMLNYYENSDSVMVCLAGDAFENRYGHMLGQGHMSGGMMGDQKHGETEWQHHMNDEHQQGDEHFGGFDMQHHTFGYRFEMMDGSKMYYLNFQGQKH